MCTLNSLLWKHLLFFSGKVFCFSAVGCVVFWEVYTMCFEPFTTMCFLLISTSHSHLPLLAEQYESFVKFTQDQIMRRYGTRPASCKYSPKHLYTLSSWFISQTPKNDPFSPQMSPEWRTEEITASSQNKAAFLLLASFPLNFHDIPVFFIFVFSIYSPPCLTARVPWLHCFFFSKWLFLT